jgi:putative tricarboxylic transport membrane protein
MGALEGLTFGLGIALRPENLLFCLLGVTVGTLVGVLPGLGPVAAISLLLPVTFQMSAESAFIMLSGIYYGSMYGGSTTSILVNIPGEAASVVTCLDGYAMACQGRAGPALAMSAIGSFIGGTVSVLGLMLAAPPLAALALSFGPPEYFALMILGFAILAFLSGTSMLKSLVMGAVGVLLGVIGVDTISGASRFVYGVPQLLDGIGIVPVAMGLFGVGEVLTNVEQQLTRDVFVERVGRLLPSRDDWRRCAGAIVRGTGIGLLLGLLPGGGTIIASFAAYGVERRLSASPERFGRGAIEGLAAPETANNAATGSAFIPMLTLGVPANAVMAILLGALMVHGLQTGPMLMQEAPQIFWGTVASMYVGNVLLLVLNLPLLPVWVRLLDVPYTLLFPLILLFCIIGVYSLASSVTDVFLMIGFGVLGWALRRRRYEVAPLVLALVLGPLLETALRQSLILSNGSPAVFFTRPLSAALLVTAAGLLTWPLIVRRRPAVGVEE